MADKVASLGTPINVRWADNGDGTVSISVSDAETRSRLAAIEAQLATIDSTLDSILTKLGDFVNVKVIP
ncbi:MAG: hypothetical protein AB1781_10955 [Pseudomonadota bacterium]